MQKSFINSAFEELRTLFLEKSKELLAHQVLAEEVQLDETPGETAESEEKRKRPSKKYFETKRKFERLSPVLYKRTHAPRLTTTGNTFHGMKKELLLKVLKRMSTNRKVAFIDFDLSAAHTRIAKFLLSNDKSELSRSNPLG